MAKVGENTTGPSYNKTTLVEQENKSLKRETRGLKSTEESSAIPAARQRVTKDQRKTGRVG